MTEVVALGERAARLERAALAELDAVLAGTAMCRVDGTREQPAKHWEGRCSALAQVRRTLRRATPGTEQAALAAIHAEWSAQLGSLGGDAWQVYTRGGLQALEELT